MWCDNCLLIFPLRAGAMGLAIIMALYQVGGAIFLFKYGDYYFTFNAKSAEIYGGFAMAQAAFAVIALIALSARSYLFSRFVFVIYPIILLLGAARAGLMTWELYRYKDRISWTCNHGGIKWFDAFENEKYPGAPALYEEKPLPNGFCGTGVDSVIRVFTLFIVIDFIMMCYFYFLIWRFNVRLQHYPVQKNDLVYP